MVGDAGIFLQADDLGVADIGSVQKGAEEEQRENGKDAREGRLVVDLDYTEERKYRISSFSRIALTSGEFSLSMARGSTAFSIFSSSGLGDDILMGYIIPRVQSSVQYYEMKQLEKG